MNFKIKSLNYIYFIFILTLGYAVFYKFFQGFNFDLFIKSLSQGDFFINYSGGFVRRGLDGEFIYLLSKYSSIAPWKIQKGYSFIFLIIFFVLNLYIIINYKIKVIAFLSMACLYLYFYYAFPPRKDHIIIVLFISLLFALFYLRKKNKSLLHEGIVINIFFIIGTLIHELFFFFSIIPILFFLKTKYPLLKKWYKYILIFLLPILTFLMCIYFSGTSQQEKIILDSWQNLNFNKVGFNKGIFGKPLLFWDYNHSIGQYLYTISIFILNFIFIFYSVYIDLPKRKQRLFFFYFLILQNFVAISLVIVSIDYARWVFFCNYTSIVFIYFIKRELFQTPSLTTVNNKFKIIPYILYPFVSMPFSVTYTLNQYIESLPINIILKTIF